VPTPVSEIKSGPDTNRPFKGVFSTNRLPTRVLTRASEVSSSCAFHKTLILSFLLPIFRQSPDVLVG